MASAGWGGRVFAGDRAERDRCVPAAEPGPEAAAETVDRELFERERPVQLAGGCGGGHFGDADAEAHFDKSVQVACNFCLDKIDQPAFFRYCGHLVPHVLPAEGCPPGSEPHPAVVPDCARQRSQYSEQT